MKFSDKLCVVMLIITAGILLMIYVNHIAPGLALINSLLAIILTIEKKEKKNGKDEQ